MRVPIVAGNWKMNTAVEEAVMLVRELVPSIAAIAGVEKVVCPPFVSLTSVAPLLGTEVALGAQNVFYEDKGAYTGEISPTMLAPLCRYVIIGHSERRQYFGETDEIVNRKVHAAMRHGLRPIVCVGENFQQNEAGETEAVVTSQVRRSLANVADARSLVVAYEPVWAIGTGRPATGVGANAVIGLIRQTLSELFGPEVAAAIRIQYGGSVTAANAAEFFGQPEIDGALVGGASLRASEFAAIVAAAARARSKV